jgi:hypothetical protein
MTRGLSIAADEVVIDYIGSEGNPRQFRVEAQHGQLQKTLNTLLLEFGLYESQHIPVEQELENAELRTYP